MPRFRNSILAGEIDAAAQKRLQELRSNAVIVKKIELRSSTPDSGHRMAPLALTRGDPSGIGPELALKAWLALHDAPNAPAFFVAANAAHLEAG